MQVAPFRDRLFRPVGLPFVCLIACASSLLSGENAAPLRAEEPQALIPGQANGGEDDPPSDKGAEVYINDSLEAADVIAKAERLTRENRWNEAAELLHRTSGAAGDKLIAVSKGHYVGIRSHIADLICSWPEQGLEAYRSVYERELLSALSAPPTSRRMRPLLDLFARYFCTATAAGLADTIGQLAIEAGDLALAESVYRLVLARHPDQEAHRLRYGAMLTLISEMRGVRKQDETAVPPDLQIRWKGSDRAFGDVLADVRESFEPVTRFEEPSDWPIFGGRPERDRIGEASVDELGLLWRRKVFDRDRTGRDEIVPTEILDRGDEVSVSPNMHPVVSGEFVFAQRYREIAAVHKNTGVVSWRFQADLPVASEVKGVDQQAEQWTSVTIHDGRLFAALPGEVVPYYGFESAQSPPELVCLDARTGSVLWRRSGTSLNSSELSSSELSFDSSPVVHHGVMYVVARRRRSFGFEDCYIYGLDASNGRVVFQTHLGSASTGSFGAAQPTRSMVTLHGDTVYVCTNLGCYAAVSAHTGTVRWIRLYDRDARPGRVEANWEGTDANPHEHNPIVWSEDRLVVFPVDSESVHVLAAADGHVLQKIPVAEFGGVDTLLGVEGNIICGVGAEVSCYDLAASDLLWSSGLSSFGRRSGRGVWSNGTLLIPTVEGLVAFTVSDGTRKMVSWDTEGRGGNLLAMPDHLYVAGGDQIAVFVRKEELWNALRARMAEFPTDPLPALELAEVALRGGEVGEALKMLEESVRRVGGYLESLGPPLKRRFFDDVLTFVDVLSDRSSLTDDVLDRLFNLATQAPYDPESHVRYRFRFARVFEKREQPERALRLYHQILRDRSLRELTLDGGEQPSDAAAVRTQARIADLIQRNGVSVYAPFEKEAARWLEEGRASEDTTLLARLVATFPNSGSAPKALISQAELTARRGRPSEAARLFATAYNRYPKHVNRPELMRSIADAYESAGQLRSAYRWLTKAAREHPAVMTEYRGRIMGFLEYRDRLAQVRDDVEPRRARVELPLEQHREEKFDGSIELLVPQFADHPACRWSHYFISSSSSLRAFDSRTGEEVWPGPATIRSNAQLLITGDDIAIFATLYEVFALDLASGQVRWSFGEYPPDFDEQLADWEHGDSFRSHSLHDDQLVSVRNDGQVSCVSIWSGRLLWSQTHRPVPTGPVRIGASWVIYHVVQNGRTTLCRLDADTGKWAGASQTQEEASVVEMFLTLDAQVVLVSAKSLSAYDLETGAKRWESRVRGHVRPGSLLLDIDAIYLSDDGRVIRKMSLEDGRILWESERLTKRSTEEMSVTLKDGSLIVSTPQSCSALDEVTGLTLWHGTAPDSPNFVHRLLTASYAVAVDVSDQVEDGDVVAYFYDHRNASGVIPSVGGVKNLGKLKDIRAILAVDGGLVLQTGSTVLSWTHD